MLSTVTILVRYPMAMGTDRSSATGRRKEGTLSADAAISSEAPTDTRARRSPAPMPPPGKKGPTWRIEGNLDIWRGSSHPYLRYYPLNPSGEFLCAPQFWSERLLFDMFGDGVMNGNLRHIGQTLRPGRDAL
jgi:hypothetical protein